MHIGEENASATSAGCLRGWLACHATTQQQAAAKGSSINPSKPIAQHMRTMPAVDVLHVEALAQVLHHRPQVLAPSLEGGREGCENRRWFGE